MAQTDAWDRLFEGPPIATPSDEPWPVPGRSGGDPTRRARRRGRAAHREREPHKNLRLDIQGLRAVAVVLVVLFHAGVTALPGGYVGVDVFFVISGFLITSNIVRSAAEREFSLLGFYANRARRLLPAAFVTIAATCLASYLLLPAQRFDGVARDALASAYYAVNWRLANSSVDYLQQDAGVSPFQHFWSLAVEEQYYLVWPLLLIMAFAIMRSRTRRWALYAAVAAIIVPSLLYSISYTNSDPGRAYFVTTTRMWELGIGGAVAVAAGLSARTPRIAAALLSWVGIAAIFWSAFVFTGSTLFPGAAAAVPTVGAALLIACAPNAGRLGPAGVLSLRVPVFIGGISYSLYLWHWPIIVLVTTRFAGGLPLWAGLTSAAASVVPAYLSYRLIEQPGMRARRFASTASGLGLGLVTSVSGAAAALLLLAAIPDATSSGVTVDAQGNATNLQGQTLKVGAQVLGPDLSDRNAGAVRNSFSSITPSPLTARVADTPAGGGCIASLTSSKDVPCLLGARQSSVHVDLVGDSHATQWAPALDAAGYQRNWRIQTHAKDACPFTTARLAFQKHPYDSCTAWNTSVMKTILAERPKLAIFSEAGGAYLAYRGDKLLGRDASQPVLVKGYEDAFRTLQRAGIRVAVIAETPVPGFDVPSCVTDHPKSLAACARPKSKITASTYPLRTAATRLKNIDFVDLNAVLCPTSQCPAVIGGVLIYRDTNHLGATYTRTASTYVGRRFAPIVAR